MNLQEAIRLLGQMGAERVEASIFRSGSGGVLEKLEATSSDTPLSLPKGLVESLNRFFTRFLEERLGANSGFPGGRGEVVLDLERGEFRASFTVYGAPQMVEIASYTLEEAARSMGWSYPVPKGLEAFVRSGLRLLVDFLDPTDRRVRFLKKLEAWAKDQRRFLEGCTEYRVELGKGKVVFLGPGEPPWSSSGKRKCPQSSLAVHPDGSHCSR